MRYQIPAQNYETLEQDIAQLNKRAKKMHLSPITLTLSSEEKKVSETGNISILYNVDVTGVSPKLNGYTFIAVIEHLAEESNIIRVVPTANVQEGTLNKYRTVAAICEHCKLTRKRNDTYLVQHENGKIVQVGSNCLSDFLGHVSVHELLSNAMILIDASMAASKAETYDDMEKNGSSRWVALEEYLGYVAYSIRNGGFISKKLAMETERAATSILAWNDMLHHEDITDRDRDRAAMAMAWIRDAKTDTTSDYMYNLYTVCKGSMVMYRHIGLAASLIAAYERTLEKKLVQEKRAATSQHMYAVGDKINGLHVTCTLVKELEGEYGVTYLTKFLDTDGNDFTWFSSSVELEQGMEYTLKGTVKKLDIYNNIKVTVLTRCKCVALTQK